jgi:hypothetical protein
VTPLETNQAAEVLDRARRALERGERLGGGRVTMAAASR